MKYLSEVKGKSGTIARVVAYSVSKHSGTPLITFEYEAYRGILSELNTHGILCKNAESSRAVPIKKRIEQIRTSPYIPIHWGSNQAGMVAGEEITNTVRLPYGERYLNLPRDHAWRESAEIIGELMTGWDEAGYHKQIVNRIGEAFTTVKGVISGTEWDNFFHLRLAPDADPAIKELASCMWKAKCEVEDNGLVEVLSEGEWHTPYVEHWRASDGDAPLEYVSNNLIVSLEEAKKISAVACGQVSFRKLDTSEETVERVWNRLMCGESIHASVTQHQGTPIEFYTSDERLNWEGGVSHLDREGNLWSAQFKHWVMFRKTIPNEVCNKFIPKEVGDV